MRPVNLIPADERRGETAATRTGPLPYIVIGVLVLVLGAVAGVVTFDKKVSERQSTVTNLEATALETQAQADSLQPFVSFQQIRDARIATVDGLARSRFDWDRVLRELSRVLPQHIWLTEVAGTVAPEVEGGGQTGLRESVPGPALEMTGCGRSQSDVARLVSAMQDIDGVTRVAVSDSSKPEGAGADAAGGESAGDSCQTRSTIPQFNLIAAFDEVVVAEATPTAPLDPSAPTAAPADGTPSPGQQESIDTATGIAEGEVR